MIPLVLRAEAEPGPAYVTRLSAQSRADLADHNTSRFIDGGDRHALFSGERGLLALHGLPPADLDGDVVLVTPADGRAERIFRAGSEHNTLLVTERCDQLCVMCSQPPKKTHIDRFALFADACRLAAPDALVGISGGEPTLYRAPLFELVESVLRDRPDLRFHILSNGQHFTDDDIVRLRDPVWRKVAWGVPLYAAVDDLHDRLVGKTGAAAQLREGLARLILAGSRIELRTVVMRDNVAALPALAAHVATFLQPIEQWSIMQLEHAGFARARWRELYYDHARDFDPIGDAIDRAALSGINTRLFNFPRCTVPIAYRDLAAASISDWKRRYAPACTPCRERSACTGFFEWHPTDAATGIHPL